MISTVAPIPLTFALRVVVFLHSLITCDIFTDIAYDIKAFLLVIKSVLLAPSAMLD
jgi:hypothetical protein